MKTLLIVVGLILIALGVLGLLYEGFPVKEKKKVLEMGDLEVSTETEKRVPVPPLAAGAAMAVGAGCLVAGAIKKSSR